MSHLRSTKFVTISILLDNQDKISAASVWRPLLIISVISTFEGQTNVGRAKSSLSTSSRPSSSAMSKSSAMTALTSCIVGIARGMT